MKKYIYLLLLFIFSLTIHGCGNTPEDNTPSDIDPIELSKTELFFESSASSQTITVTYSGKWRVEGANQWCTVAPASGNGNTDVVVTVADNNLTEPRELELVFYDQSNKPERLKITQYKLIKTNYKDVAWSQDDTFSYDTDSGEVTLSSESEVEVGQVLVLPIEAGSAIRVVESVTEKGTNTVVTTSKGDMQDLFCDIDFTLATSQNAATKATRSVSGRVITPSKIYAVSDNGDYDIIYDASDLSTRINIGTKYSVSVEKDLSGYSVFKNDYVDVSFEKAVFDTGVDFVFDFEFSEDPQSKLEFKGKLESMKAYLEGHIDMDYLAKCVISEKYSYQSGYGKEVVCLKKNVIKALDFEFMVGAVPVTVTISTDLCALLGVEAEAEVALSSGFSFSSSCKLGMEYDAIADSIKPIQQFDAQFDAYPLTLTAYGTANVQASLYPKFNVKFYDLLGPSIEPISYIEKDIKAGFRASTDGNNYIGWQSEINSGMKYRLGLSYDFWGFIKDDIYEDIEEAESFHTNIITSPASIELSKDNKSALKVGEKIEVKFETLEYNNLTYNSSACSSVYVIFDTQGVVSDGIVKSDESGVATVYWAPINTTQTLTARIVDMNGQTISEVTYAPEITFNGNFGPDDLTPEEL